MEAREKEPLLPQVDAKTWVALTYTAIVMIWVYYFGKSNNAIAHFREIEYIENLAERDFYSKLYWVGFGISIYFVIPWMIIRLSGQKLRDYGVRLPSSYKHLWIYLVMLVIVCSMAYQASFKASFQQQYPYYKYYASEQNLFYLFWAGRAVRFFALEFFFRGYLLFALRPKMGDSAFFVSMIPYCMLHFGKPFPEVVFTIVGGVIFCLIAARTKSIWGAVVLHVALAIAMDVFSIMRRGDWTGW